MTYTGGYSSGFTGGGNYGAGGQYGNQTAGAGYQGGLGNLAGQAGAMYGNFGVGGYGSGFGAGYGGGFNPAGMGAAAAGSVGGAGGDVTSGQDTASAAGTPQQNQQQQPNQQQSFQNWFRSLQNPGAWTPGGSAQAAGAGGGGTAGGPFNQGTGASQQDWQNALHNLTTGLQGGIVPPTTGQFGTTPGSNPTIADPNSLAGGGSGQLGTDQGIQAVPAPGQGGDVQTVQTQNVPQTSQQAPITTGDTSTSQPSYTSQNEDPTTQQQQGGQQQQGQQGQQAQGGRGGGGGGPLAQFLRRLGMPPQLAQLAAMAMQQGMMRGMGGRGRFPFRGGMPGMMGRGRGRGRFGMRGGVPMGVRRSPLTPFAGGGGMPFGGGGGMGFPFGGQDPTQPVNNIDVPDPRQDPSSQAPQFAPDDAELDRAGAGQGGPAAGPTSGQAPGQQPSQRATATPAGNSRTGVPLSRINIPGSNHAVTVASDAAPAFSGFLNDLAAAGAPLSDIGGYNFRNIAGTGTLSQHAFGNAIDVNQRGRNQVSPAFRNWANQNQQVLRQLIQKWGLISGGDWRNPDFGHFEFRRRAYAMNNPATSYAHGIGE